MTPATKKLIELIETSSVPLGVSAETWDMAAKVRAVLAEVRAEPTASLPGDPTFYGVRDPIAVLKLVLEIRHGARCIEWSLKDAKAWANDWVADFDKEPENET